MLIGLDDNDEWRSVHQDLSQWVFKTRPIGLCVYKASSYCIKLLTRWRCLSAMRFDTTQNSFMHLICKKVKVHLNYYVTQMHYTVIHCVFLTGSSDRKKRKQELYGSALKMIFLCQFCVQVFISRPGHMISINHCYNQRLHKDTKHLKTCWDGSLK